MDIKESNSFLQFLLDNISDGVYMLDLERRITFWSAGAERISGFPSSQVVGSRCSDNILAHVDDKGKNICMASCPVAGTLGDGESREVEVFLHHREGHRVPVRVRVFPMKDEEGKVVGAIEIFRDRSDESKLQERLKTLEKLALVDPLTEVGNRRFIEDALRMRLAGYQREGSPRVGLLFMDIDHFKRVNDRYGHILGDEVLRMVARSVRGALREFDFLGRWGGEEFVALVLYADEHGLAVVAERVRTLVEKSWIGVEEGPISVTVSVGGTLSVPGDDVEGLVARADALMYRSKREGRNRVTLDVQDQ